MVGKVLQPSLNAIVSIFLYTLVLSSAIPADMLRFLFAAMPFCSCFV